jgi:putative membrane-bound dehydrogenase-like protein
MKSSALCWILSISSLMAEPVSLFDGKTLNGWEIRKGEEMWWRVQDGMITGGSLDRKVPKNTFLTHNKRHANFDLRLKVRLTKGDGFINSGVQIRSIRVPGNHEMSGYQVDAGIGWWGKLYDESRRNKVIGEPIDAAAIAATAKDWEWNDYRILCEGPRIRTWINGVPALDYTEKDPAIPLEGLIGVQAHSGGKFLVQFKDITLEELPPTPGAPAWPVENDRSPESQKASFILPPGYEVELVASEREGVHKPVTVAWDHSGRMWTMTATEYPVDANENTAAAEALFNNGGKDRILVIDEPWKPQPQTPRVFAEGLAIPLGILPWKNGVLAQHGHEIRFYQDENGDGKSDRHDVILSGFGIQDSHLFPHQFERSPGGWFQLAQGLFNRSTVVRPAGQTFANGEKEIVFDFCKLARARLDGSDFELLTAGPNNIWGMATARDGSEYLQEANDLGHPVSEFIAGTHYPSGYKQSLRPYAPVLPPSTPGQPMGGTGLSGMALAEDEGSPFAAAWPGEKTFYIANPITNRIQIVTRGVDADGHPTTTKREDFMTSSDDWFRPVAVHFGPDGFLYVVDWYNKIISHNEVPRAHPDRDKTRGRIWRIRHKESAHVAPPDLAKMESTGVLEALGHPNARVARMAWAELGDRRDSSILPELRRLSRDASLAISKRLNALWAMQEMGTLDVADLVELARDASPHLRREAIEAAGDRVLSEAEFLALCNPSETDFAVKCAVANALRRQPSATVTAAMLVPVGNLTPADPAPKSSHPRIVYEHAFVRYLVRWALESHPAALEKLLAGPNGLSDPAKELAVFALPAPKAAETLLQLLPTLDRPLRAEEAALLGSQISNPAVLDAFREILLQPARREGMLKSLSKLDASSARHPELVEIIGQAAKSLLDSNPTSFPLVLDLARQFRLKPLAPTVVARVKLEKDPAALANLLRTLNEMQAEESALATTLLDHPDPAVAREALILFSHSGSPQAVTVLAKRWPEMPGVIRPLAINGLLSKKTSAEALAASVAAGDFEGFDPSLIEKLIALLGNQHPQIQAILKKVDGLLEPLLEFPGKPTAVAATGIDLEGAFSIEAWVLLDKQIDNRDSLIGVRGGGMDINFYDGLLRFFAGKDWVIANRPVMAGVWTHCAITRDANGKIALFLDGEAAGISAEAYTAPLKTLDLGKANQGGGTGARFCEFRIWNVARTAEQIRHDQHTRMSTAQAGLIHRFPDAARAGSLPLQGGTAIVWGTDFPTLVTPEAAAAIATKFQRFHKAAEAEGDAATGRKLFQATCMICHQVAGEGVALGPDLSGAGAMGVESLLRNILTPNAQLESGYYRHDITLADGTFTSGFMASETKEVLVLRQIGADERTIPRKEIKAHQISKRSLMPEGLIDGFNDRQVSDLFAYLKTLR